MTPFTTPVGRLVQGDAFKGSTTDMQGAPLTVKNGPNAGQPRTEWFVALAFAKNDPAWPAFKASIDAEARASWPQLFPTPGGPCVLPTFSDKVIDGDGYDTQGRHFGRLQGFAGHWIVRFSNGFPPKVAKAEGGVWREARPDELKRGYYCRVSGSMKSNDNAAKPGLHMNWDKLVIDYPGDEIQVGPSMEDAFGAAGATPAAPAAYAPPVAAALPSVPVMLPAAGGATYESFIAQGWTDAAMIDAGYMAAPVVAPPAAPMPPAAPPAAPMPPAAPAAPAYDGYRAPAAGPAPAPPAPPPTPPAPPPAAPGLTMTGAFTYDALKTAGWSDDAMIAAGHAVRP